MRLVRGGGHPARGGARRAGLAGRTRRSLLVDAAPRRGLGRLRRLLEDRPRRVRAGEPFPRVLVARRGERPAWTWSAQEREHHDLMAIWSEARVDADTGAPWDRHVAWARADGEHVSLLLLRWAGSSDDPSPVSVEVVRRLDADDIAEAAGAMEALREQAAAIGDARARSTSRRSRSPSGGPRTRRCGVSKPPRRSSSSARRPRCAASSPSRKRRSAGQRRRRWRARCDGAERGSRTDPTTTTRQPPPYRTNRQSGADWRLPWPATLRWSIWVARLAPIHCERDCCRKDIPRASTCSPGTLRRSQDPFGCRR